MADLNETEQIFWLDQEVGTFKGGYFIRCNLNKCIKIMNDKGLRVTGIKIDLTGESDWNLELIGEVVTE